MVGKRDSVKWIKWLIRFINLDMAGLPAGELREEISAMWEHLGATEKSWSRERAMEFKNSLLATDSEEIRPGMLRAQKIARDLLTALCGMHKVKIPWIGVKARYIIAAYPPSKPRDFAIYPVTWWITADGPLNRKKPPEEWEVAFSTRVYNINFFETIGGFLLIHLPHVKPTNILQCSECKRFEFTNRGKKKPRCTRCLTKARVEKWRESERQKHNKARY